MDLSFLHRLAEGGLAAFPPSQLRDAAVECWDWGVATGDSRWCILSRTLAELATPFDDEGMSSALLRDLDRVLASLLPDLIDAENARDGASIAQLLYDQMKQEVGGEGPLP